MARVRDEDAGTYRCVAKSVAGEATSQAAIRVVPPIDPHPSVDECPYAGYCLNGGTCMYFKIVGELLCECAEGFKGRRCEDKEVYPTFSHNCQGPLRHLRHSRGLRCPRNQPHALWEKLQQSLARRQKVSPWTKPHLLSWSPTNTRHVLWPHYARHAPHSSRPHPGTHRNHLSPASVALQIPSSADRLPVHYTTPDPFLLDLHSPKIHPSQVTHERVHVSSEPLATQLPRPDYQQLPTLTSQLNKRMGHESFENPPQEKIPQSPALNFKIRKEADSVLPVNPHSRIRHHHHQQRHPEDSDSPLHDLKEGNKMEVSKKLWDQKVSEVGLAWTSSFTSSTVRPTHYFTPHQDSQHQ